ncbi:hypothetical protein F383_25766 [Gossypium arboreum]|uniref:Uncharacterized protein n=1 Tax=Gossypium arboreum TaxID=29729 RepID=A0A0B0P4Z9_GOSAR|nr:hypothetical protein F383_25766 [Gossypium arboreum]
MRASVRPCLGHGIDIDMTASVRPCLGHGIGLNMVIKLAQVGDHWRFYHTIQLLKGINAFLAL